jgi:hypothetical protein
MKTTTTRPATAEERARLEEYLRPSRPAKPLFIAAIMVGLPATFALFVVLNVLLEGAVPAVLRLAVAVAIGGAGAWYWGKRETARTEKAFGPAPEIREVVEKDLAAGTVSVTRFDVEAIVKVVPDRGRFVRTTWFAKLADGTVALLVAPDLEEVELKGEFPATSFEIATGEASHFVASVTRTGGKLAPAGVRMPLSDGEWEELGGEDDAPVPYAWEEVLERAAHNPLSRREREKAAAKG